MQVCFCAKYGYTPKEEYFNESNKTKIVVQVEGEKGINNIDEILKVRGYDILFIGPYDLSQSLGIPGNIDDPIICDIVKKISIKTKKQNKTLGIFVDDIEKAKQMYSLGCEYLAVSTDVEIFRQGCSKIASSFSDNL